MRKRNQPWSEPPPTYTAPREPLAKRLGRFATLIGAIFAIAVAVIMTQQLSRDSLALLIGLSCGVMAMAPTIALGYLVWRRDDRRRQERVEPIQQQPAYPTPPVIVVSPQALTGPGQAGPPPSAAWNPTPTRREFTIVGGSD